MVTVSQAETMADQILKRMLAPYGFTKASVRAGYDHDGDAALFIDAYLDDDTTLVDGLVTADAIGALQTALSEQNDLRFPYLSFRRPSDEAAEVWQ